MVTKTVAIYVFFDDILKSMDYKEPTNRKMTDAEIATVILIAARYFDGVVVLEKHPAFELVSGIGLCRNSFKLLIKSM